MYYAACERLAETRPEWRPAIEKIDRLLHQNAKAPIEVTLVYDFAGEPERVADSILTHLERAGLIHRIEATYCRRHRSILPLLARGGAPTCDLCIDSGESEIYSAEVIQVVEREKKKVFISYASRDADEVERIVDELQKHELDVWFDRESIRLGSSIPEAIDRGLEHADYYMIVLSPESVESPWVRAELDAALMKHKTGELFILPLLLRECKIPLLLQPLLFADFTVGFDLGLRKLIDFFTSEAQTAGGESPGAVSRLKGAEVPFGQRSCQDTLAGLEKRELRKRLTAAITRDQLKLIWGDLFEDRLDDTHPNIPLPNGCQELIHRASRESCQKLLYELLCDEAPHVAMPR